MKLMRYISSSARDDGMVECRTWRTSQLQHERCMAEVVRCRVWTAKLRGMKHACVRPIACICTEPPQNTRLSSCRHSQPHSCARWQARTGAAVEVGQHAEGAAGEHPDKVDAARGDHIVPVRKVTDEAEGEHKEDGARHEREGRDHAVHHQHGLRGMQGGVSLLASGTARCIISTPRKAVLCLWECCVVRTHLCNACKNAESTLHFCS